MFVQVIQGRVPDAAAILMPILFVMDVMTTYRSGRPLPIVP